MTVPSAGPIPHLAEEGEHMAVRSDSSKGRPTPFRDELPLLRRERLLARARLGPASEPHLPKRPHGEVPVRGRKKPPSQMHLKRDGG
ncbi:hypothetical protein Q664_44620 [Archangium violaceum Cb vi76]|uniref:Uncharacterized protein n=2 Tax=Archangium violaceum TaxID=83451 RepID=A0A084SHE0_9BACT|nr:hypothetical protein Q664_44620 [Archangium violaceum Cb vi76]